MLGIKYDAFGFLLSCQCFCEPSGTSRDFFSSENTTLCEAPAYAPEQMQYKYIFHLYPESFKIFHIRRFGILRFISPFILLLVFHSELASLMIFRFLSS